MISRAKDSFKSNQKNVNLPNILKFFGYVNAEGETWTPASSNHGLFVKMNIIDEDDSFVRLRNVEIPFIRMPNKCSDELNNSIHSGEECLNVYEKHDN